MANLALLAAICTPVLSRWGPAKDDERNPNDNTQMLGRLDQPERYSVDSATLQGKGAEGSPRG